MIPENSRYAMPGWARGKSLARFVPRNAAMTFALREMNAADRTVWVAMRVALWPEDSADAHAAWIDRMLADKNGWGFMAATPAGKPVGFAEVALRPYANGCNGQPVLFLEGIWVRPEFRRQGIGAGLIARVAAFATQRGYREIGSDALIDNLASHAAHRGWGFSETERVVYFRKDLR
jgi:aminoglycoside 6'-N-acetyltransferase I